MAPLLSKGNQSKHFPHSHLWSERGRGENGNILVAIKFLRPADVYFWPKSARARARARRQEAAAAAFYDNNLHAGYENFFRGKSEVRLSVHPGISSDLGKGRGSSMRVLLPLVQCTHELPSSLLFRYDDFVTAKGCEAPFRLIASDPPNWHSFLLPSAIKTNRCLPLHFKRGQG